MPRIWPFDKHTDRYERWFEKNRFAYRSELRAVSSLLPRRGLGVEIGVGTGRFAAPLGIRIGIEPSRAMAKVARQRGIEVVQAVAEALPLMDEMFDFALMVTVLCFLDDVDISLRETHRVLKCDGSLLIGFVDRDSPLGRTYQRRKKESTFYAEARFCSVEEVVLAMERTGFKEFDFVQTIFRNVRSLQSREAVRQGYGEGSFVVLRARKP
jgi:SAM-dependent methyltransferase